MTYILHYRNVLYAQGNNYRLYINRYMLTVLRSLNKYCEYSYDILSVREMF